MKTYTTFNHIIQTLTLLITLMCFSRCWSDVAVVTHPSTPIATLTPEQAANIFLDKTSSFPDGSKALPVDQNDGEISRTVFYKKVVKKDASQLNAYWARLIFTGKGHPPKAALDDDEVLELVSSTPNSIGYINKEAVDDTVKVLFVVED